MKKLVFLPMILATILLISTTRTVLEDQDMSFSTFLQLFPKENLPFDISSKEIKQIIKKGKEYHQDSTEQRNVNAIFKKYLHGSESGNNDPDTKPNLEGGLFGISYRGYFVNTPIAQMASNDYFIIIYLRNFMGLSNQSQYYLSVLDKKGQHILTKLFATINSNDYIAASINKKLDITFKGYERKKDSKTDFTFKSTATYNLMEDIKKVQKPSEQRAEP